MLIAYVVRAGERQSHWKPNGRKKKKDYTSTTGDTKMGRKAGLIMLP